MASSSFCFSVSCKRILQVAKYVKPGLTNSEYPAVHSVTFNHYYLASFVECVFTSSPSRRQRVQMQAAWPRCGQTSRSCVCCRSTGYQACNSAMLSAKFIVRDSRNLSGCRYLQLCFVRGACSAIAHIAQRMFLVAVLVSTCSNSPSYQSSSCRVSGRGFGCEILPHPSVPGPCTVAPPAAPNRMCDVDRPRRCYRPPRRHSVALEACIHRLVHCDLSDTLCAVMSVSLDSSNQVQQRGRGL